MIWQDVDSCFQNPVGTGAIINLSIKDPLEFFPPPPPSFISKFKKGLETSLFKVNVVFLANFIKPQSAETDIKHFQTKNRIIDKNTDLIIFYEEHIKDNLIKKL